MKGREPEIIALPRKLFSSTLFRIKGIKMADSGDVVKRITITASGENIDGTSQAAALRLNATFATINTTIRTGATTFATDFVDSLVKGETTMQSLQTAASALGKTLVDAGLKTLVTDGLNALSAPASSLASGVLQTASATSSATILTTAGTALAASMVSGATDAASILGIGGTTAGTNLGAGSTTAATVLGTSGATTGAEVGAGGELAGAGLATGVAAAVLQYTDISSRAPVCACLVSRAHVRAKDYGL
jgi:hypothetical protein